MSSKGYTVHAFNASGQVLGLDGKESAGQPSTGLTGQEAGQKLFVKTGFRLDVDGRAVRNRVRWFVVTAPTGRHTAHGRPDVSLVMYTGGSEGERTAVAFLEALSAPQGAPEAAEAAQGRAVAAEAPKRPQVAARVSGTARVNLTTVETLTVGKDNPRGEPVYVRTLPERHPIRRGKSTMDVFGHEGYWFTVPGGFPAALPSFAHVTRRTFAVYQTTHIVAGAWVWVVQPATGDRYARPIATSLESRRAAVRDAVSVIARERLERLEDITGGRLADGREEVPPVRLATTDGDTWTVHVRCSCVIPEWNAVGSVEHVSDALEIIGDEAWELCGHGDSGSKVVAPRAACE